MEHCQWSIKRKFCCRKWNIYNTEVLKSNLCDYKDTFILVRGDITVLAAGADQLIQVAFKNCAHLLSVSQKLIEDLDLEDAEDLDLVMPMYNLIECSSNYSHTTVRLWFCSKYVQV